MKTACAFLLITLGMLMLTSSMFAAEGVALGDAEFDMADSDVMKRLFSRQERGGDSNRSNNRLNRYMQRLLARQNYHLYRQGGSQVVDM